MLGNVLLGNPFGVIFCHLMFWASCQKPWPIEDRLAGVMSDIKSANILWQGAWHGVKETAMTLTTVAFKRVVRLILFE